MSEAESLADSLCSTHSLLTRYLAGFDDANATKQATAMPNHVIWTLGHLALYNHRAAEKIAGRSMAMTWDPEPFAFNSQPVEDASAYPPLAEMIRLFEESVRVLADAVRKSGEAGLDRQTTWGGSTKPVSCRDLAIRMIFHNGTHCGQIVDLRRALGLGRLF